MNPKSSERAEGSSAIDEIPSASALEETVSPAGQSEESSIDADSSDAEELTQNTEEDDLEDFDLSEIEVIESKVFA